MKRVIVAVPFLIASGLSLGVRPSLAQVPGCYIVWADAPEIPGPGSGNGNESRSPRAREDRFHYSASEVLDIDFYVLLPAGSDRSLELKILTPQGHLYQTLPLERAQPVAVEAAAKSRAARASTARTGPRGRYEPRFVWASAKLPVAGTTIVNNSLYGRWTAAAYLKGDATPCAKPRTFDLSP